MKLIDADALVKSVNEPSIYDINKPDVISLIDEQPSAMDHATRQSLLFAIGAMYIILKVGADSAEEKQEIIEHIKCVKSLIGEPNGKE